MQAHEILSRHVPLEEEVAAERVVEDLRRRLSEYESIAIDEQPRVPLEMVAVEKSLVRVEICMSLEEMYVKAALTRPVFYGYLASMALAVGLFAFPFLWWLLLEPARDEVAEVVEALYGE